MAEREKANRGKHKEVDQKKRVRQKEPQPSFDKFHSWDQGLLSLAETPFYPRMDEHAAMLSRIPFTRQRHDFIMQLHKTYGNRYVQRLVESINVQAKLTVSDPGDIYEQEADRVADAVTKTVNSPAQRQEEEELQTKPVSSIQQQPEEEEELIQGESLLQRQEEEEELIQGESLLQRQEEEEELQTQADEEEEEIQTQPSESQLTTVAEDLETRINSARGGGQPLPDDIREPMEQAFKADFSGVRVHTDSEAHLLSQKLSAKAFTTVRDIFFRWDEYSPGSDSGRKLIAHELTHVVQQNGIKEKRGAKPKMQTARIKDRTAQEKGRLQGGALTSKKGVSYISGPGVLAHADLLMRVDTQTVETGVSATARGARHGAFGLTWPENVEPTLAATGEKGKWKPEVTALEGKYSMHWSPLPGKITEAPDQPKDKETAKKAIEDLANLGVGGQAEYYMADAVKAHEKVHGNTMGFVLQELGDDIAKEIEHDADEIWAEDEYKYDSSAEAVDAFEKAYAGEKDAVGRIQGAGGPAFRLRTQYGGLKPCSIWGGEQGGAIANEKDHLSGDTDIAETIVVKDKIGRILAYAKDMAWKGFRNRKWSKKIGQYRKTKVTINLP